MGGRWWSRVTPAFTIVNVSSASPSRDFANTTHGLRAENLVKRTTKVIILHIFAYMSDIIQLLTVSEVDIMSYLPNNAIFTEAEG